MKEGLAVMDGEALGENGIIFNQASKH
jgi:hypothetical protein